MFIHYASPNNGHAAKCPRATDWHKTQLAGNLLNFFITSLYEYLTRGEHPVNKKREALCLGFIQISNAKALVVSCLRVGCRLTVHHNNEVSLSSLLLSSFEISQSKGLFSRWFLFLKDKQLAKPRDISGNRRRSIIPYETETLFIFTPSSWRWDPHLLLMLNYTHPFSNIQHKCIFFTDILWGDARKNRWDWAQSLWMHTDHLALLQPLHSNQGALF